jgi:hypothetical protein
VTTSALVLFASAASNDAHSNLRMSGMIVADCMTVPFLLEGGKRISAW